MLVMKFGGTSVGDANCFKQVVEIVKTAKARDKDTVVVVSAMSGITNLLIEGAKAAARGDHDRYPKIKADILNRHLDAVEKLNLDPRIKLDVCGLLEDRLHDFERLCRSVATLRELTARGLDVISSLGERLSAAMLAGALTTAGCKAQGIDADEIIITDDNFGEATPLMEQTCAKIRERVKPLLARGITPVVTGFMGATVDGVTTTLGRGGSDYTGAILGACLGADEIQIWTDVDGIMTADPRIVREAYTLPTVTYSEAAELSYFGAKVLHPKTVMPAAERGIPLRIVNTFNPTHPGTMLVHAPNVTDKAAKAVTVIKSLSLITVQGRGMLGVPGIAARTFAAVARVGANVLMISQSSSEQNICFIVPGAQAQLALDSLRSELELEIARRNIDRISSQDDVAIVALVGEGIKTTPGVAGLLFTALGKEQINVQAVAQGSSECNLSLVVGRQDADNAVRAIHRDLLAPGVAA